MAGGEGRGENCCKRVSVVTDSSHGNAGFKRGSFPFTWSRLKLKGYSYPHSSLNPKVAGRVVVFQWPHAAVLEAHHS